MKGSSRFVFLKTVCIVIEADRLICSPYSSCPPSSMESGKLMSCTGEFYCLAGSCRLIPSELFRRSMPVRILIADSRFLLCCLSSRGFTSQFYSISGRTNLWCYMFSNDTADLQPIPNHKMVLTHFCASTYDTRGRTLKPLCSCSKRQIRLPLSGWKFSPPSTWVLPPAVLLCLSSLAWECLLGRI